MNPDNMREAMDLAAKVNSMKDSVDQLGGKMTQTNNRYTITFPGLHKHAGEVTGGPFNSLNQASSFVYGYRCGVHAMKDKIKLEKQEQAENRHRRQT